MSLRQILLILLVAVAVVINILDWCFDLTAPTALQPVSSCDCPCKDSVSLPERPTMVTTQKVYTPIAELRKTIDMDAVEGLDYLDEESLNRYHNCVPRASHNDQQALNCLSNNNCGEARCYKRLRFLNQTEPRTALVSFPGSGNTWLRYLIEQATGVFTGSVYCDKDLKVIHPGEHITTGNVVVIKTHQAEATLIPISEKLLGHVHFNQAIFLLRNPYDALISEANRRWGGYGHTGVASETDFIGNPNWEWYLQYKSTLWSYQIKTWLDQSKVPVHVVQYENLVANTRKELKKVLKFLNYTIPNKTLDCVMEASDGYFKRTKHLNFDPYSQEDTATVSRIMRQATPVLDKYGISYTKPTYH